MKHCKYCKDQFKLDRGFVEQSLPIDFLRRQFIIVKFRGEGQRKFRYYLQFNELDYAPLELDKMVKQAKKQFSPIEIFYCPVCGRKL